MSSPLPVSIPATHASLGVIDVVVSLTSTVCEVIVTATFKKLSLPPPNDNEIYSAPYNLLKSIFPTIRFPLKNPDDLSFDRYRKLLSTGSPLSNEYNFHYSS